MADYILIACLPNQFWATHIVNQIKNCSSETLRKKLDTWESREQQVFLLAVHTKLAVIKQVVRRCDESLKCLSAYFQNEQKLDSFINDPNSAYKLPNSAHQLPFEVVANLDSFLFESKSTYEMVGRFLKELFKNVFQQNIDENKVKSVLGNYGCDTGWIDILKDNRDWFIHNNALWFAVERISKQPLKFELVLMKKDTDNFQNPDDYLRFAELREIYNGFDRSLNVLTTWISQEIQEYEQQREDPNGRKNR